MPYRNDHFTVSPLHFLFTFFLQAFSIHLRPLFNFFELTKHVFFLLPGMTHVKCHKRLKNCLIREQKAKKVGFSKECPASVAVPTMIKGMDLAILLSELGGNIPGVEKFI